MDTRSHRQRGTFERPISRGGFLSVTQADENHFREDQEFEETYKGFASFEFDTDAFDMQYHEDCITISSHRIRDPSKKKMGSPLVSHSILS